MSTDKTIDNYAAFRTLTPVDFTPDGSKLLVKQKIGSREDGIWETSIYVYDFKNKVDYEKEQSHYFCEECYQKINEDSSFIKPFNQRANIKKCDIKKCTQ